METFAGCLFYECPMGEDIATTFYLTVWQQILKISSFCAQRLGILLDSGVME